MARLKLVDKWKAAQEVQLSTALDLNLSDTTVYRLGRLVITSVRLHDVGLVGGKELVAAASEAPSDTEASLISAELTSLGLPTTFGKKVGGPQHRREGKKTPGVPATSSRLAGRGDRQPRSRNYPGGGVRGGSESARNGGRDTTPWLQGFDEQWGCHYYYNTQTQESTWETPAEGFVPWEEAARATGDGSTSVGDETQAGGDLAQPAAVTQQQQQQRAVAADAHVGAVDRVAPAAAPSDRGIEGVAGGVSTTGAATAATAASALLPKTVPGPAAPRPPLRMLTEEDLLRAMGLWEDPGGVDAGGGGGQAPGPSVTSAPGAATADAAAGGETGQDGGERGGDAGDEVGVGQGPGLLRSLLLHPAAAAAQAPSSAKQSSAPRLQQQRPVPVTALSEEQLLARLSLGAAGAAAMPPPPPAPAPPAPSPPPPRAAAAGSAAATPLTPAGRPRMLTEEDVLRSMGLLPDNPAGPDGESGASRDDGPSTQPTPAAGPAAATPPPSPPPPPPPGFDASGGPPPPPHTSPGVGGAGGASPPTAAAPPVFRPPALDGFGAVAAPPLPPPGFHPPPHAPQGPPPSSHHHDSVHSHHHHHHYHHNPHGPFRGFPPPLPAGPGEGFPHGGAAGPQQAGGVGSRPPLPPPGFGHPPPFHQAPPPVDPWGAPGGPYGAAPPSALPVSPMSMLPAPPPGFSLPPPAARPPGMPYGMPAYPPFDGYPYPPFGMPVPPYGMPPPPPGFPMDGRPPLPPPPPFLADGYGAGGPMTGPPPPHHPHHYHPHHPHHYHHPHHHYLPGHPELPPGNGHHHHHHPPPPLPSPPPTPAMPVASDADESEPVAAADAAPEAPKPAGAQGANRRAVMWTLEELERQLEIMAVTAAAGAEEEAPPPQQQQPVAAGGVGVGRPHRFGPSSSSSGQFRAGGEADARQRRQRAVTREVLPYQQQQQQQAGQDRQGVGRWPRRALASGSGGGAGEADSGAASVDTADDDAAFYDTFAGSSAAAAAAAAVQRLAPVAKPPVGEDDGTRRVMLDPNTAAYVRTLLPRSAAKYWMQRYSLFSRFDSSVQLDTEGWWSVTPEVLAAHQAERSKELCSLGLVAVDACCGCGGNVIQMAEVFPVVIGVEISPKRVEMARHNASIYGVGHKCQFLCADFFAVAPGLKVDALFMSPPWGGPKYQHVHTFDVFYPLVGFNKSLLRLLDVTLDCVRKQDGVVAAFLPRNTDLVQLAAVVPEHTVWEVERAYVNNKLKGITLYCHPGAAPGQPNVRLAAEAEFSAAEALQPAAG